MAGNFIGDVLGALLGVKANIGGVGFAMLLLILISTWAIQKGYMKAPEEQGIKFWSAMYIPIVVAMSSIQNVAAALSGGVVAVLGGAGSGHRIPGYSFLRKEESGSSGIGQRTGQGSQIRRENHGYGSNDYKVIR